MAEKHYEMLWDCQFCGTDKLLGKTHRFCPNCGAPQDPDARYFPADEDKVAVEDHEYVGNDVHCPACNSLNTASAVHCGNCGSPMEGGEVARQIDGGDWIEAEDAVQFAQARNVAQEKFERDMAAAGVTSANSGKSGGVNRGIWIGIGVVLLLIVILGFLFSRTEETTVIVTGHEWVRVINVEEYRRVQSGDWRDQLPAGAYNRSCEQRQREVERVPDGETCRTVQRDNGDGTFIEREVCETVYREQPVLDTWCDYNIDRWVPDASISTNGMGLAAAPFWGDTDFDCSTNRLGCQREADRDEIYTLVLSAGEEVYRCEVPFDEWEAAAISSTWTVEVRQVAGGAVCGTLAPS